MVHRRKIKNNVQTYMPNNERGYVDTK